MSNLQIFKNDDFGEIRVVELNNEPWFVATDICKVLDIKNVTQAINRLDEDERSMLNIGRQGVTNIVNEYGLYNLILASRKPEAKKFKRWVTHEVIPSIRKHGAYMTPEKIKEVLMNPDTIIQLATALKEEQQRRLQVERQIEEQKPLVTFAETALKAKDNILVRQLAKIAKDEGIETGEKRLYNKLRSWKMIMPNSTEPYQQYVDKGFFVVEEKPIDTPYGVKLVRTTKVTPKGQVYIIERLKTQQSSPLNKRVLF